jgi:hypothetical protein
MDPTKAFLNQVVIGGYLHPFVDRYARFGVTFDSGRGLGPCMLQPRSCAGTNQPVDLALTLCLRDGDQLYPVTAASTEHLPWSVAQHATQGDVAISARHVYLDAGAMICSFSFTNTGKAPRTLTPCWIGNAPGDRWPADARHLSLFGLHKPPLRRNQASWRPGELVIGLCDHSGTLPSPEARLRWRLTDGLTLAIDRAMPVNLVDVTDTGTLDRAGSEALQWRITGKNLTLAPGQTHHITFTVCLRVHPAGMASEAPWSAADPESVTLVTAEETARRDFLQRIGWTGAADGPRAQRAWRARWSLLRTGYQGDGVGELGRMTASTCVPNSGGFTRIFFWDSLFTATALSRFNADFARDAIRTVFIRQDPERGYCPEHVFDRAFPTRDVIGEAQAPVASWAVERHLEQHPTDSAFLSEMYPKLALNHRHWQEYGDRDRDGLAEWTWCGQTADDSPIYDEFAMGRDAAHGWLPPIASVSLNSFLYRDAVILAGFADRLGRPDEAKSWRVRAEAIESALMRICYVPTERRFWDYNHATRRHCKIKTFYMFWPLWAGMHVPADARDELIDRVLLDPKQFFGEIPFPSVAYDEATYTPAGYWRGKSWPHISYWLVEMLVRQGRHEAAALARRKVMSAWLKDPYHAENMTSNGDLADASGSPEYNWGAALVSHMLEESAPATRTT